MNFHRTKDFNAVHSILTRPEIYPLIGDDSVGPVEDFEMNEDPLIWYVMAWNRGPVGIFTLMPQNTVCWEVHVVMLLEAPTRDRWCAGRQLVPWLRSNTDCERLTGAVPAFNRGALMYGIHGIGMRYVGRHEKAFLKHGQLQDLILLGRSVNE